MKNTKKVPAKTQKAIYQEANSCCPFCSENDVTTFEIHHIKSRAENGGNEPENLILCCGNCHSKITNEQISIHDVYRKKRNLEKGVHEFVTNKQIPFASNVIQFPKQNLLSPNLIQFNESINNEVVTSNLHIHGDNKTLKLNPPSGIIAADGDKRSYIKYLIDRYNEFKKADRTIKDFHHSVVYKSIKNKFKCKWDFIPINLFPELAIFLQNKIDNTILGRNLCKQNRKNYSTFDEYLHKYRHYEDNK